MERRDFFKTALAALAGCVLGGVLPSLKNRLNPYRPKPKYFCSNGTTWDKAAPGTDVSVQSLWDNGALRASRVVAAKINGEWVNTSAWTPEQIAALGPGTLKLSPGTGQQNVRVPALGPGPHRLEVGTSDIRDSA